MNNISGIEIVRKRNKAGRTYYNIEQDGFVVASGMDYTRATEEAVRRIQIHENRPLAQGNNWVIADV